MEQVADKNKAEDDVQFSFLQPMRVTLKCCATMWSEEYRWKRLTTMV